MTESPQDEVIELRFVGGDIAPHNVRASDLADLLKAAETLVWSAVLREHDELTKDDIFLALSEVRNKSLGLRFASPIPQVVVPSFKRLAANIQHQRFDLLGPEAHEALRRITTFTRKNRCKAEFRTASTDDVLATVESSLVIPAVQRFHMQTTIHGRIVEAGGKSPNVHLETLQGQIVVCSGTQTQVKQLAERLYELVGITGTARSDVVTLELNDFEIHEILPFEATSIVGAVGELEAIAAPHFDGIDVNEYVRSLREDVSES